MTSTAKQGRFVRLAEAGRAPILFTLDGEPLQGQKGDTVLSAILLSRKTLGHADLGDRQRAGFCLMGACQDCWVWQADGTRLQTCVRQLEPGMALLSGPPENWLLPLEPAT
ncbi:MAG: (2Fe-2S)-binding protein [Sedimentitalea sp.]|uniref:(2Fe-2S)-binding protein n=1 Tax=Sedimentitalea sp. TaxID=2048915 RepID=UPI0032664ECA